MMLPRAGFGFDVHRLEPGDGIILGGIKVPASVSAVGHSDADVLLHALCDALLGAAALGDIGHHFPDTDPAYKGLSSAILLKEVCTLLKNNGYGIGNMDATIGLQTPKLAPYISEIRTSIAEITGISENEVSVKATTTEKLGYAGRKEGVLAYAVAMIYPLG